MSRLAARRAATALIGAAVAAGAVTLAAPALAAYPPNEPQCSLAASANTPGASVTISGVGFLPGETVRVGGSGTAQVPAQTTIANADGSVRVVERLGGVGSAQFTLSGTARNARCGALAVKAATVTRTPTPTTSPSVAATRPARPQQPGRPLSFTGVAGLGTAAVVGLGLLGGGAALVVVSRRRRDSAA